MSEIGAIFSHTIFFRRHEGLCSSVFGHRDREFLTVTAALCVTDDRAQFVQVKPRNVTTALKCFSFVKNWFWARSKHNRKFVKIAACPRRMKRVEMKKHTYRPFQVVSLIFFSNFVLDVDKTLQPNLLTALFILRAASTGAELNRERNSCCNCKNTQPEREETNSCHFVFVGQGESEHDFLLHIFFSRRLSELRIPSGQHVSEVKHGISAVANILRGSSRRANVKCCVHMLSRDPDSCKFLLEIRDFFTNSNDEQAEKWQIIYELKSKIHAPFEHTRVIGFHFDNFSLFNF